MKRAVLLPIGYALIVSSSVVFLSLAYSAPCPPVFDSNDTGDGSQSTSCATTPVTSSANPEFGVGSVVAGAACPSIPNSFPATHTVTNDAEFWTKYQAANCGDALIFANSFSWSTDRVLEKNCSAQSPIYILGYNPDRENIHVRTFDKAYADLEFRGDGHVMAGFRFDGHQRFKFNGSADSKVLCNHFMNGYNPSGIIYVVPNGGTDNLEVAYNQFENTAGNAVSLTNCDQTQSGCTDMPENWWIHHNTLKNRAYDAGTNHDGFKTGSDIEPAAGTPTFHSPHGSHFGVIENNLFDRFEIGEEIISAKSSGLIIRNNCVLNGGNRGSFVNRKGFNNVWYGNWVGEQKYGSMRIAGRDNIIAYNYFRAPSGGNGLRLHPGTVDTSINRYTYVEASDNVIRRNVWSNITRMIEIMPRSTKANDELTELPSGNTYSDNAIYSSNLIGSTPATSYTDSSGQWSSSQFCANNNCGSVSVNNASLPQSSCGDPALFNGPSGGAPITVPNDPLYHPEIRNKTIPAPSWW